MREKPLRGKRKMMCWFCALLLALCACTCSGATDELWSAVYTNDVKKAAEALDRGADVNDYNKSVMSTRIGNTITVYTNSQRAYTPLMIAAQCGNNGMVSLLLSRGADVRLTDHEGRTALSYAISGRRPDTMKILLGAGADPSFKAGFLEITPVMDAAMADCADCLEVLDAAKAPLDAKAPSGRSAVILASEYGSVNALGYLLKRGMDANSCDNYGKSALIYAADNNRLDAVRLLLARGAAVDGSDPYGRTALFGAAALGRTEVVRCLLAHGARPKVYAPNGQSALGLAKKNGHKEIVDMLLKAGAL